MHFVLGRWLATSVRVLEFGAALVCVSAAFAQSQTRAISSFANFRPRQEIEGERFVGRELCAQCHSQKNRTQSKSSMAHALGAANDANVLHSHPKLTFQSGSYSYEISSDRSQILYRVSDGKETIVAPLLYAFGNGHIAQTYVYNRNGKLYEARVSYYTGIDGLDWTIGDKLDPAPSLEEAAGRDIDSDEAHNCFSCHGTAATLDGKLHLEGMVPGVNCEACHSPGAKHVSAMKAGAGENPYIFNPKTLAPEILSQEFCGACHRGVDAVAMMPDLGGINNVRFQPYRIFNSRGHDPNDPRLACTACHDPHADLKPDDYFYDGKCVVCHLPQRSDSPLKQTDKTASKSVASNARPCSVAKQRCVSCHMPKVALPGAHFQFTDHRIRIAKAGEGYPY